MDYKSESLVHYGIRGMRWGVRRYQSKDGSLTPAGKRRLSKDYTKRMKRVSSYIVKSHNSRNLQSYDKAADYMKSGGKKEFDRKQEKKYGKDFANRDGYVDDYFRIFDEKVSEYYNVSLYSAL